MKNQDFSVLSLLSKSSHPVSEVDISKSLSLDQKELRNSLFYLLKQNKVKKLSNGRWEINAFGKPAELKIDSEKVFSAKISIIKSGSGFAKVDNEEAEYFIEKTNLKSALHGDKVKISPVIQSISSEKNDNKLGQAVVIEVTERSKDVFVGKVVKDFEKEGSLKVEIDDAKISQIIKIDSYENLVPGHKVLIRASEISETIIYGSIIKVIGHVNDPGTDILSIVYANGIEPDFKEETIAYVNNNIHKEITPDQRKDHKDLTDRNFITIDPWDAKDLDDAVYVEKMKDGNYFLSVSIADLGTYVKWKSPLDEEAFFRGTSVYLTDRVIPMLPHKISNDICSLNPHEERLCITCDMVINDSGNFVSYKAYPSIILSKRRFAYDEVNDYYSKKNNLDKDSQLIKRMLDESYELHLVMRKEKEKRGYIDFDIKEPKIIVNEKGVAVDIKLKERGTAQKMIEDFMIAANEAVTLEMIDHKFPFIYRTHDAPVLRKVNSVKKIGDKVGFKITGDLEKLTPLDVAGWLENQRHNPSYDIISKLILRSMAKAKYEPKNNHHFGLASLNYTHFTSPIRRYPDLIVNRLMWMFLFESSKYTKTDRKEFENRLQAICEMSSLNEIKAVETERAVNSMKFAEYMQPKIGQNFFGTVSTLLNFGMFIELENTIEGLIPISMISDRDFFEYSEERMIIIGRKSGITFSLGEKVEVELIKANPAERKIEFKFIRKLNDIKKSSIQ